MCSEFCSAAENESPFCAMRRMRSYSRLFFRISVRYSLQQFAAFKGCGRPFAVIFSKMTRRRTFSASAVRFLSSARWLLSCNHAHQAGNTLKIAADGESFFKYASVCSGGQHKAAGAAILGASLKSRGSFQFSRPRLSAAAR